MVKVDYAFSEPSVEALLAQGGPVTVPDAHLLFTADFSRSGHDLLLTGEDGKSLLIVDYFGPHGPVDLVSPEGAILKSSAVQSLAGPLAPGQYAQAGDQQPAEIIGKVVTLEGSASAQRTDGTVVELSIGDSVGLGDVVQTGAGANLGIAFLDGTVFNLSAGSRMVLDNLVYQAGGSDNSMTFSLVQGTFSFVAGQIAPTGEMKIDTPVATMGIRGTSGIMKVASIDGATIFRVIPDPGSGHLGAYVLYSLIDGTILATVDAADLQWLLTSPTGTPTSEPADPNDQEIIDNLIEAFERRNAGLDDGSNDGSDGGTRVVTIGSGIDTGISPLDPNSVDAQLVDLFAGLSEEETEEPETTVTDDDTTTIIDTGNGPVNVNQPASFGGDESGDAVEDVGTATGGQVIVDDPDGGSQVGVQPQTGTQGEFGTFTIAADGTWTYVLNNANPAVQALPGGATETDSFVVTSADGSATITIVITITGTNDVPTVTGTTIGDVGEDATGTATGIITVSDPDTGESSVAPQSDIAGSYGTFAITAAGVWTYVLSNANAAVQALPEGDTLTESFTVTSADGTTSETIVITITGANDGAVIGGTAVGEVAENSETITASGSLTVSDVDTGEAVFQTQSGTEGDYGSFSIDESGNWTYTLDNGNPDVDALNVDDSLTDSFTVTAADGTTTTVTINILGTNDAAVLTPAVANLTETNSAVDISTSGTLPISDVDSPESFIAQSGTEGDYGSFSIDANGAWIYTADTAHNEFVAGQTYTDSFTVTAADGTTTTVTINILGTNDAAVLTPAVANLTETNSPTDISTSGTLPISDVDSAETFIAQTGTEGEYGSFSIDANGAWTYTADTAHNEFVAGQTYTDSFTVTAADGTTTTVTINILGTNDAAVLTPAVANLTETNSPTGISTSGTLPISDVDSAATFMAQSGTEGDYGSFSIGTNGAWTYTADSAHNEFVDGQTYTDTFTVTAADGTTTTVTINILGTNDAAVLTPAVANLTETNSPTDISTSGTLPISDVDSAATFMAQSGTEGDYGSFSIGTNGAWTYTADSAHNEFVDGQTYTDTFTVTAADGTTTTVTINILGTNDAAVLTPAVANLTETNSPTDISTSGTLPISDVDSAATFIAQSGTDGLYGSFSIGTNGAWTYTADSAHNEFVAGQTYTDTFTVTAADGTTTTVTINILGTNDAAVLTPAVANLTETNSPTDISTSGTLPISDVDSPQTFVAQSGTDGLYGSFSIGTNGAWTYTADSAHNEFVAGQTYTDTFTVTAADGTTTTVTINILGTNDAAVLTPAVANLTETNSAVDISTSGTLPVSDVDSPQTFVAQSGTDGLYGSFSIGTNGAWTYTADTAHNEFVAGQTYTDSFTVTAADGTTTTVTINILGTNDAAVITGDVSDFVDEAPIGEGSATASGDLNATDVDNPATFVAQTNTAGEYGSFSVDETGAWTYTLDNENPTVNGLNDNDTRTDSFTVFTADGTEQVVTVTINGSNDAAVIAGNTTGTVIEDNFGEYETITTGGTLTSDDVDNPDNTFQAQTDVGTNYGSFSIDAAGNWTYTLDNENAEVDALSSDSDPLIDTFTVYSEDGTPQDITVTINGADDGPVGTPDTLEATEDEVSYFAASDLLSNDTSNGGELSIAELFNGDGGTVSFSEGGYIAFTPDPNFSGTATFSYAVTDGSSTSDPIAVTVNVQAVADAPTLNLGNYGFETGDVSNWSTSGQVTVVTTSDGYTPVEGTYMTVLNTDGASQATIESFLGLTTGALDAFAAQDSGAPGYQNPLSGDATSGSAAVIQIAVTAGDQVSFSYNFVTNDYMPYNDYAIVTINGQIYTELSDVLELGNTNGNVSSTGWQTFTYTATETGILTIGIADVDIGDQVVDSRLLIDNLRVGVTGDAGDDIPLSISSSLVDTDGSEHLSVLVTGLPSGATLSAGHFDSGLNGWVLESGDLAGLTVSSPVAGEFTLTVTATATESSNGSTASTTGTLHLIVDPVDGNSAPTAEDDNIPLFLDLTVSPHGEPVTIAAADLLYNDSDPDEDTLTIISVSGTSQEGATVALDANGDIVYTPPQSFNSLNNGEPIADQFTYTVSDGKGGSETATVFLDVSGNEGNSSFALFSLSAATVSTESEVPPVDGFNQARRDGDSRAHSDAATIQAIAAAAGIAAFTPQWAQAETHQQASEAGPVQAHDGGSRGWQGMSFADLAGAHETAGTQPDPELSVGETEIGHTAKLGSQFKGLNDIIGQHFEGLSAAKDTDEKESDTPAREAGDRQDHADANAPDTGRPASRAEAAPDADGKADAHDNGLKDGAPNAEGPAHHFDGIVDFSKLPAFDGALHDVRGPEASFPDLKHGDFAGIVDFSRDLLPEPHGASASLPDRAGFKGEGFTHAPAHDPVHVAVNDIVQSMAHDAEAASNHHPH